MKDVTFINQKCQGSSVQRENNVINFWMIQTHRPACWADKKKDLAFFAYKHRIEEEIPDVFHAEEVQLCLQVS